jgi:hypothetical protein
MARFLIKVVREWGRLLAVLAAACLGLLLISSAAPTYQGDRDVTTASSDPETMQSLSKGDEVLVISEANAKEKDREKKKGKRGKKGRNGGGGGRVGGGEGDNPPPPPPPTSRAPITGIYEGWHDPAGVDTFYGGLGYSGEQYAHEFIDHRYGWSTIGSGVWSGWKDWVAADNRNRRLTVSLPLLPTSSAGDFQGIVDGRYDPHFRQFAQGLQNTAAEDTIVRLGWEMNGETFPWAVNSSNVGTYKAAYRHAVDVMEAVEPSLQWEWEPNVTLDAARLPFEQLYPGDTHVDYIGLAVYDYHWSSGTADPGIDVRWRWLQDPDSNRVDDSGMVHHVRFAAAAANL